jgi:hypothetical protein
MKHRIANDRALHLSVGVAALFGALVGAAAAQTLPWPDEQPQKPQQQAWPGDSHGPASSTPTAVPAAAPPAPMMAPPPQMGGPARMGGAPPGGMAPPGGGGQNECAAEFTRLRGEVEKRGQAAKAISERKGSREELCKAVTNVFHAETTWVNYSRNHAARCGIPPEFIKQLNAGHNNLAKTRQTICATGATAGAPPAPSLSEALGTAQRSPLPATTTRRGGTMDTLTGNPIR